MDDNVSKTETRALAAAERRESVESQKATDKNAEILNWAQKDETAQNLHKHCVEEKREKAHASNEDVSAGHARAEIYNAIRESTAKLELREHEYKTALALDKKASNLELIKEKQAHLQHGGRGLSEDTVFGAEHSAGHAEQ
ncbi:hypothetical protein HDU81_000055 [Chytriomyces hyalinus]|nr:hypothetical protein HDU81_000055 [Chytriomyces hyalinus]